MEKTNPTAADASVDHDDHQDLLDDLMAQVAPCFARRETRLTCKDMVHGLLSELEDRNCIKVVCDLKSNALYFSREPIPTRANACASWRNRLLPFRCSSKTAR